MARWQMHVQPVSTCNVNTSASESGSWLLPMTTPPPLALCCFITFLGIVSELFSCCSNSNPCSVADDKLLCSWRLFTSAFGEILSLPKVSEYRAFRVPWTQHLFMTLASAGFFSTPPYLTFFSFSQLQLQQPSGLVHSCSMMVPCISHQHLQFKPAQYPGGPSVQCVLVQARRTLYKLSYILLNNF